MVVGELRSTLQKIWNDHPQKPDARAVQKFHAHLQACLDKAGGHLEIIVKIKVWGSVFWGTQYVLATLT